MTSHQTVSLGRGRHTSPDHGACVMELASMLAGEPFTDRPRAVCPVVAAILRGCNDGFDDDRRQVLLRYASESVGTRDSALEEARRRMAEEFFGSPPSRFGRLWRRSRTRTLARAAFRHVRAADEAGHHRLLELVDRMIAAGRCPRGAGALELQPLAARLH